MAKSKKIILGTIVLLIIVGVVCLFKYKNNEQSTYVVTFNSDGGTAISKQVIEDGSVVVKPNDPVKEGYIFIEWLLNGKSYNFNEVINGDITLVASWKEITPEKDYVTIKFNTDGGTTIANSIIEKGEKVTLPAIPTKDGYTFVEWQLDGVKYNFDTEVLKDIELIAKWEKGNSTDQQKKYTVTFNSNGGSKVAKQTVQEGEKATKPADPTRKGYTFTGWTLNGNSYNFDTTVTKNISLVANWKKIDEKSYTVTFNSNGGSAVSSQIVVEGNKATKPANPTKSGFAFVEWQLNGSTYDFNSKITSDITLTAKWKELGTYTVTFDSNGGSNVSSQSISEGSKVLKPSNPTKEGYTFSAWQLNGQNYDFNSSITGNITLKATWNQKKYEVKVTLVDSFSPDRILTVYEDNSAISVKSIKYTDGTLLCNGSNTTVNKNDIEGESSLLIILNGGTQVTASVK